jgi:hypothetical protein
VIDLEATEVPPETTAAAPEPPQPAPNPDNPAPPEPPEEAPAEPPQPPSEPPGAAPKEPPAANGRRSVWLPVLAGAAGGVLAFALLWFGSGLLGGRELGYAPVDLDARLAAIEKQAADGAGHPAAPGVEAKAIEGKAIEDMAARLAKLESAQAALRAPVTDPAITSRLNANQSAAKALGDNLTALSGRADRTDTALREGDARIEKLTTAVTALQAAAREAASGSDRASRFAIATMALRDAVVRGSPFTAELAVMKPLAFDASVLAVLEPFAASGVPTDAALGQELAAILRPMLRAAPESKHEGGFLDRLQANAEKLVRIRPIDETGGDERNAVLARIVQRAERANIAGARAELAKLPSADRAPAEAWIAKVEARDKALDASRRLAADAIAALKATP